MPYNFRKDVEPHEKEYSVAILEEKADMIVLRQCIIDSDGLSNDNMIAKFDTKTVRRAFPFR